MSCGTQEYAAQRSDRGLSRGVLNRMTQRRTDQAWLSAAWRSARVLVVDGDRTLASTGPAAGLPTADPNAADLPTAGPSAGRNAVGPNGVGSNAVGPNGVGPTGVGPNGVGPSRVGPNGVGPNAVGLDNARLGTAGPDTGSAGSTRLVMLDAAAAPVGERYFLGLDPDGVPYFAVAAALPDVPGAVPVSLRAAGHELSDLDADLATTAVALANWHRAARFDPCTGEPTSPAEGGWVRTTGSGRTQWPRTDPAMIVLVHDGIPGPQGRCLLAHKPEWPTNRYSCIAGYVDPGESVEETVRREVTEEVGVTVHDIRYVTSQPWPFPRSLMLAYTALADPTAPVTVDGSEIAVAHWFRRADFDTPAGPTLPFATSVAYLLITTWLADR